MILFTIAIFFILEILFIYLISRKLPLTNPTLFFIAVPMVYSKSLFLDYIFFGIDRVYIPQFNYAQELSVFSENYLFINMLYFTYSLGVFLSFILKQRAISNINYSFKSSDRYLNNFGILFLCLAMLILFYDLYENFGVARDARSLNETPLSLIALLTSFFFSLFCFLVLDKQKKISLFILALLLFIAIFNQQREHLVIVLYAALLKYSGARFNLLTFVFIPIVLLLVTYYKPIIVLIYLINLNGIDYAFLWSSYFFALYQPTFSGLDPSASLLMISDFLNGNLNYSMYTGSYLTNTIMQFYRTFFDVEWLSIGEYTTLYYTDNRMGTASSMLIESILNFWFFGPFILGFFITYLFLNIEAKNRFFVPMLYLLFFIFILKLVRTELAVVLKIYILPFILAYLCFKLATSKKNA